MSAVMQPDWVLKGWKVWYYLNNQVEIYSSKTHNWVDLPPEGVQVLHRYYKRVDPRYNSGEKHWKEQISGLDLYASGEIDRTLIMSGQRDIKVGKKIAPSDIRLISNNSIQTNKWNVNVDDSLTRYEDKRKTLQAWLLIAQDDTGVKKYYSDQIAWQDVPQKNIIGLARYMKAGNQEWVERIWNADFFVLDNNMEQSIVSSNNQLKRGTLIDFAILNQILMQASQDEEVF